MKTLQWMWEAFPDWSFEFIDSWAPVLGDFGAVLLYMFVTLFLPLSPLFIYVVHMIWKDEKEWARIREQARQDEERYQREKAERAAAREKRASSYVPPWTDRVA